MLNILCLDLGNFTLVHPFLTVWSRRSHYSFVPCTLTRCLGVTDRSGSVSVSGSGFGRSGFGSVSGFGTSGFGSVSGSGFGSVSSSGFGSGSGFRFGLG